MALTSVCCLGTTAPWMQTGNGAQGFRDMGSCCQKPQSQVGWADLRLGRGLLGSAGSRPILDRGGSGLSVLGTPGMETPYPVRLSEAPLV